MTDSHDITTAWTLEGYWNAVLGQRCAAQVVAEFELVADRQGLDEWLGLAEAEAASAGGIELPEEWADFRGQVLDQLEAAAEVQS